MSETATQTKLLTGLAEAFGLPASPMRVEVYDNSHIQGTNAVGAMIVAGPEGFIKAQYRKFNMKGEDLTPGDGAAVSDEARLELTARSDAIFQAVEAGDLEVRIGGTFSASRPVANRIQIPAARIRRSFRRVCSAMMPPSSASRAHLPSSQSK